MPSDKPDEMDHEFTKRQLAYLDAKFDQVRDDMQTIAGIVMEHFTTQLSLALEPTRDVPQQLKTLQADELPARVTKLERAELPSRVSKLEAAVFPPKPARRRRG